MRFTVFTPTYNRAHTLGRLFESLKRQSFRDFEWLVVDDGSTDNTEELISGFIAEKPFFEINYIKTENGGKHRAINRGMPHARGELTFLLDSDDWLTDDSLCTVDRVEKSIVDKRGFAGVCGLKCYDEGNAVGQSFEGEWLDITTLERNRYGILGDKAEVYYTSILREYPFPEIDGEKFATESIVWSRIAHDGYKLRFFNENIYLCEYVEDGLTAQGNLLYARNPKQWGIYINQEYTFGAWSKSATRIHVYLYYLYLRGKLPKSEMIKNIGLGKAFFHISILWQTVLDFVRRIIHGGKTLKASVKGG
jgi:glycosyltransferase involved in cell wall biosynthesis